MDEWEEQKYELSAEMDALKTWRYDMIKRGFDHGFTGDGRFTPIIFTSLLGIGETMLKSESTWPFIWMRPRLTNCGICAKCLILNSSLNRPSTTSI